MNIYSISLANVFKFSCFTHNYFLLNYYDFPKQQTTTINKTFIVICGQTCAKYLLFT